MRKTITAVALAIGLLMVSFFSVREQWVPVSLGFVNPGGLTFSQVDFVFDNATALNSYYGYIEVNVANLTGSAGLQEGFVNVYTDAGWVVQDMIIDSAAGVANFAMYFDLGIDVGTTVTSLSAYTEYTIMPTANFTDGPRVNYPVMRAYYNAEGLDVNGSITKIPYRLGSIYNFNLLAQHTLSFRLQLWNMSENVQCADNQCFPMALSNSLQYLKNRYALPVPHNHVIGLKGDNSLVGQMDNYTNRYVVSRTYGHGISFIWGLTGLADYLNANGLLSDVTISYQSNSTISGLSGNYVIDGITIPDESVNGGVTFDWIENKLYNYATVVMLVAWSDGHGWFNGGHAVRVYEFGAVGGVPFLCYADDRLQTNVDPTDTQGLEWVQVYVPDADGDGNPDFGQNTGNEIFGAINITRIDLTTDITGSQSLVPDGKVDMRDIGMAAQAFGSMTYNWAFYNSPYMSYRWNPAADINRDGTVNMRDIGKIARDFLKHVTPWP